jgi:hypothetical protein
MEQKKISFPLARSQYKQYFFIIIIIDTSARKKRIAGEWRQGGSMKYSFLPLSSS